MNLEHPASNMPARDRSPERRAKHTGNTVKSVSDNIWSVDRLADTTLTLEQRVQHAARLLSPVAASSPVQVVIAALPWEDRASAYVVLLRALLQAGWRPAPPRADPRPAVLRWLRAVAAIGTGRARDAAARVLAPLRMTGRHALWSDMPLPLLVDHGRVDPADARAAVAAGIELNPAAVALALRACPELAGVLAGTAPLGEAGAASHLTRSPQGHDHPVITLAWQHWGDQARQVWIGAHHAA